MSTPPSNADELLQGEDSFSSIGSDAGGESISDVTSDKTSENDVNVVDEGRAVEHAKDTKENTAAPPATIALKSEAPVEANHRKDALPFMYRPKGKLTPTIQTKPRPRPK